jgi:flagellar M-ring protein FliF
MLDTVVGPGKAVVRVNADLDWTQRDATSTQYGQQSGSSPLAQSHVADHTTLGAGSSSVGGVAGLGSNVPTYGASSQGTAPYTDTQHVQDLTFDTPMTTTHVVAAPGTVQRLSVAVLVDGALTAAQTSALSQTVSAAAGLVQGRDQLSIQAMPFDTSAAAAAARDQAAQQQRDLIRSIARWAALIVVPLVLLFLLRKLLVPAKLDTYDMEDYPEAEVLDHDQPLLGEAESILNAAQQAQRSLVRDSLADMARKKPEVLAGMIGRWIDEDR